MHITRVIPMPQTIGPEAQQYLLHPVSHPGPNATLAELRETTDAMQALDSAANRARYPVNIDSSSIAGVPVRIVTSVARIPAAHANHVLICLHGGSFTTDSGSLTESIPIAHLAQTKVVSVLYRLAPEHPFPAAVDDSIAVYKELLRTNRPKHIGIYGASAGGHSHSRSCGEDQATGAADARRFGHFHCLRRLQQGWRLRGYVLRRRPVGPS
jgi:acetyl esterase/lipase